MFRIALSITLLALAVTGCAADSAPVKTDGNFAPLTYDPGAQIDFAPVTSNGSAPAFVPESRR